MNHRYFFSLFLFTCAILLLSIQTNAQITAVDWEKNRSSDNQKRNSNSFSAIPSTAFKAAISITDFKTKLKKGQQEIVIPNPEGKMETFIIEPSEVVAPEVAHLYSIKTFKGYQKGNPTVLIACDISDNGFHAGVYASQNSYFVEPISSEQRTITSHASYYKHQSKAEKLKCSAETKASKSHVVESSSSRNAPTVKRTFRLAVIASGEFGQQFGGNPYSATNVLNALASGVNMINPIYLRDLGFSFTLVSNASMVYGNPNTDGIDPDTEDLASKSQTLCQNALGVNGFDVGHMVLWADLGGAANFEVICTNATKGEGYSASEESPVTLWVDYVCHEIGHQFGSEHNFASQECGTSVQGFRYEPGEGSSIMSYANVCGGDAQYATGSDPFFHYASIKQIQDFIITTSCATTSSAGNSSDPIANAQADITIPKQTPFVLVGSATDGNDPLGNLTYGWQQYDGGTSAVSGPPNCNSTNAPMFRYRPPTTASNRSFPQYSDVLAGNNNSITWEKLPCTARTMNFSMLARDNNTSFGRATEDRMVVTVANTGPFAVTSPNGSENLTGNNAATITWTVNGTNAHCSTVDILLSTDGGATYSVITNATTNDGSESVTIPNTASTTARILIRCDVAGGFRAASTFYDMSNANFTITEGDTESCEDDLIISLDPTPSGIYRAANTLTSEKPLEEGSNVTFQAGSVITLQSGFEVLAGTEFLGQIQSCSSVRPSETSVASRSSEEDINEITSLKTLEKESALNLEIYPNPVNQQLTIISKESNRYIYHLMSLDGRILMEGNLNEFIQINMEGLSNGMYILDLMETTSGKRHAEKIIVQHSF